MASTRTPRWGAAWWPGAPEHSGNEASLSKLYDIHMLALTGGRERREDEYRDLLAAADLRLTRVIPTGVSRSIIETVPM